MQTLLEKSDGSRVPFVLGRGGLDKVMLDNLVKEGKVYYLIRSDSVEVIKLS